MKKAKFSFLLWSVPAAAAVFALSVFVKWPFVVQTQCYFSAVEEWELLQDNPARLVSRLKDNARMKIPTYTLLQFARQDFVRFSIGSDLTPGETVEKDRILGEIVSSESQILFANLQGQVNKARANLQSFRTGEKAAVQNEAVEALNYAKTQLNVFLSQYERNRKLHQQKLISDEEWELSVKTEELLRQNIQLQDAKLKVVQSGEKREAVRMMEEEVARFESQLRQLQGKISLGQIRNPIAGVFSASTGDSILCKVSRMDSVVCTMIVRSDMISHIRAGQRVAIRQQETGFGKMGTVLAVKPDGVMVWGMPGFMVTAVLPNDGKDIRSGMIGRASILTDRASLIERIRRAWNRRAGQFYL
jgi:hypothetical protein